MLILAEGRLSTLSRLSLHSKAVTRLRSRLSAKRVEVRPFRRALLHPLLREAVAG